MLYLELSQAFIQLEFVLSQYRAIWYHENVCLVLSPLTTWLGGP